MRRTTLLFCIMSLCTMLGWGQTWKLTETMTATLDDKGVLTISTTKDAEAMPDLFDTNQFGDFGIAPWKWQEVSLLSVVIEDKVTTVGAFAFANCNKLTSVKIPTSVKKIGRNAFAFCGALASIVIPNSVIIIGGNAFYGCETLTSITIPNSVNAIEENAFDNCISLTSVTIPNSVTTIGNSAFTNCIAITSITIPNSVITIGEFAFSQCTALTSVSISNSVTAIEYSTFSNCTALKSVTIPNSVTSIGRNSFWGCSALVSVTIPNSVTTVGQEAFSECTALTSITIPKSVTSLVAYAFIGCTSLKNVTIEWTTPLSLPMPVFGIVYETIAATLHVPIGTKARYQAAFHWKNFETIVEYDPTNTEHIKSLTLKAYASNGILHISGLQAGKLISIYSISGQLVYKGVAKTETEQIPLNVNGVYIVTSGNQTIKLVVK